MRRVVARFFGRRFSRIRSWVTRGAVGRVSERIGGAQGCISEDMGV